VIEYELRSLSAGSSSAPEISLDYHESANAGSDRQDDVFCLLAGTDRQERGEQDSEEKYVEYGIAVQNLVDAVFSDFHDILLG